MNPSKTPSPATSRLATSLVDADEPLSAQINDAVRRGAEVVELRVDRIGDVDAVEAVLREPRRTPLILTIRTAEEGGGWDGDDAERIALFERLGLLQPGYIDLEWSAWRRSANLRQKIGLVCHRTDLPGGDRAKNQLMLSHHDLNGTPEDLSAVTDSLCDEPAAIVKVVFTARDATDALRVLTHLRERAARRPLIALAMGAAGLATRVLAKKFGGFLSFASRGAGRESAAGQPTLEMMRQVYRWDAIGPQTRVYGLIGWPVDHSRGPFIHNAGMRNDGIDGVYLPLPVAPSEDAFRRFMDVATAPELDFHGFSVTLPHKEHALHWLRAAGAMIDDAAARCGAVNTLVRDATGSWSGHNTDVIGALRAVEICAGLSAERLRGSHVVVLGAGGVARAVVSGLTSAGAHVTIYNRTRARADALADALGCRSADWQQRGTAGGALLVNCTSIGMQPAVDQTPISAAALPGFRAVFDTVYTPAETQMLRDAARLGAAVIDGATMFLEQAARQYELWHGRPAPRAELRSAM